MNESTLRSLEVQFGCATKSRADFNHYVALQSNQLYNHVYDAGRLRRLWAAITKQSDQLFDLAKVTGLHRRGDASYAGIRAVMLRDIRGSENRVGDFNADFQPVQSNNKDRWMSVAMARLRGTPLPPVQLIQVGDTYYVRDGHHRISVARALGEVAIDAEVTVWRTTVSLTAPAPLPNATAAAFQR